MSDDRMKRLLIEQRRRMVATILGHAEREVYAYLSPEEQRAFRKKVLDALDAYHCLMLDIVGASHDENTLIEAETLELLRDVRDELRNRREESVA